MSFDFAIVKTIRIKVQFNFVVLILINRQVKNLTDICVLGKLTYVKAIHLTKE